MNNILLKDLKEFSLLFTNGILGLKLGPQPWACCQNQNERDSSRCTPRIQSSAFKIKSNVALSFLPLLPFKKKSAYLREQL